MKKPRFSPGWNEKRVQELISHYESQTEDEEFAAIEAARMAEDVTLIAIPTELVPEFVRCWSGGGVREAFTSDPKIGDLSP